MFVGSTIRRAITKAAATALCVLSLALATPIAASAQGFTRDATTGTPATAQPQIFSQVGIDQRLNNQIPLDLNFRDEQGRAVKLGDYFGKRPVILTLVYYQCPMLCTQVLNGLTSSLNVLKFDVGREFDVLTVSIDPRETPDMAMAKKQVYIGRYRRATAPQGWHFLTGDQPQIAALAKAVGFRYAFDPKTDQFAHASAIMIVTPEGKLAQYYYGIDYSPKDIRLALVEASKNKIGNVVDEVVLYCFHYDPTSGKYNAKVITLVRAAGVLTVMLLGGFIFVSEKRNAKAEASRN